VRGRARTRLPSTVGTSGQRTETAQAKGVAECGNYERQDSGLRDPEPVSQAKRASIRSSVGLNDGARDGGC
jgi:hypothetical protein